MRRFLGLMTALAALSALLALNAGPALADHVHCGDVITQDTTFDSDLACYGTALTIAGDDVTLNLARHTVGGDISAVNSVDGSGVTVTGGTVHGVIDVEEYDNATVTDVTATSVRDFYGEQLTVLDSTLGGDPARDGIASRDPTVEIGRNTIRGAQEAIVVAHAEGRVYDNLLESNRRGFDGNHSGLVSFENNVVRRNGTGISGSQMRLTATGNTIVENDRFGVGGGEGSLRLTDNYIARNAGDGVSGGLVGIYAEGNSILNNGGSGIHVLEKGSFSITGNTILRNAEDGLRVGQESGGLATNNYLDRNGDDGIDVELPFPSRTITLTGNHTWFNGDLGIEAIPGDTLGGGNWAKHNGNAAQCVPGSLCSTKGTPKR